MLAYIPAAFALIPQTMKNWQQPTRSSESPNQRDIVSAVRGENPCSSKELLINFVQSVTCAADSPSNWSCKEVDKASHFIYRSMALQTAKIVIPHLGLPT